MASAYVENKEKQVGLKLHFLSLFQYLGFIRKLLSRQTISLWYTIFESFCTDYLVTEM